MALFDDETQHALKKRFQTNMVFINSILMNTLYLLFWGICTIGVEWCLKSLRVAAKIKENDWLDFTLPIFKWIFLVVGLIVIGIFFYRDIRVMWIQANQTISKAADPSFETVYGKSKNLKKDE